MTVEETRTEETEESNTAFDMRQWRKDKVWELRSMGYSIDKIVQTLKANKPEIKISHGTVHNDLKAKYEEIKEAFKSYLEEELPRQHRLAVTGLDKVLYEAWHIFESEQDTKAKLQALNVISETIMRKQQVLGDPEQIQRAIKTVTQLREALRKEDNENESAADNTTNDATDNNSGNKLAEAENEEKEEARTS